MASALDTPVIYLPGSSTPAPPLLTPDDVLRLLYLKPRDGETSAERLKEWRGRLPRTRIGKRVFFKLVDVLEFLDQQQEASE